MKKEKLNVEDLVGIEIPFAPEIEEAVLGSMLADESDAANAIAELSAGDFIDPKHRKIFETMVLMKKNGYSINLLSVSEKLNSLKILEEVGGLPKLSDILLRNCAVTHAASHRLLLREKTLQRQIIVASLETLQEARDGFCNVGDLINHAMSRMESACALTMTKQIRPIAGSIDDAMHEIEEIQLGKMTSGLWTSFVSLDSLLGPMTPGMYMILAGRTSHGKTQFAANIIYNVACKGTPVGLFSLEMTDISVAKRILSITSGIGGDRMNRPALGENEMNSLKNGAKTARDLPVYIDDTAAITITEFEVKAKQLVRTNNVGLLIVDYLQLITTKDKFPTREQEVAYISRELRATAKSLGVPIIALSQLSRNIDAKGNIGEPKLSDLRESGSLEQDADIVFFVYRDDQARLSGSPETKMIVGKNRNGKVGRVDMLFDSQRLTFAEQSGSIAFPTYHNEVIEEIPIF